MIRNFIQPERELKFQVISLFSQLMEQLQLRKKIRNGKRCFLSSQTTLSILSPTILSAIKHSHFRKKHQNKSCPERPLCTRIQSATLIETQTVPVFTKTVYLLRPPPPPYDPLLGGPGLRLLLRPPPPPPPRLLGGGLRLRLALREL